MNALTRYEDDLGMSSGLQCILQDRACEMPQILAWDSQDEVRAYGGGRLHGFGKCKFQVCASVTWGLFCGLDSVSRRVQHLLCKIRVTERWSSLFREYNPDPDSEPS